MVSAFEPHEPRSRNLSRHQAPGRPPSHAVPSITEQHQPPTPKSVFLRLTGLRPHGTTAPPSCLPPFQDRKTRAFYSKEWQIFLDVALIIGGLLVGTAITTAVFLVRRRRQFRSQYAIGTLGQIHVAGEIALGRSEALRSSIGDALPAYVLAMNRCSLGVNGLRTSIWPPRPTTSAHPGPFRPRFSPSSAVSTLSHYRQRPVTTCCLFALREAVGNACLLQSASVPLT